MREKKVIVFIIEGPSDEAALGTIMKEHFSSNEVRFVVVHGDITQNLEHVLYNELKDFSDEEKQQLSDDFADQYEGNVNAFLAFISDPLIAAPGTYQKSWDYIEKGKNSLQRHSNMHLIFESYTPNK